MPMKEEANEQQREMEELIEEIAENEGFDVENINSVSEETAQKASKMMETYLGEEPDTQEALEFLCLLKVLKLLIMKSLHLLQKK